MVPELSVHDALVGEILGELVLVREEASDFKAAIPPLVAQVEKAGELVGLRLAEQARQVLSDLDARTVALDAAAKEFRDVRAMLMAELGVKTSAHFESVLRGVAKDISVARRIDLAVWALVTAFLTAGFVAVVIGLFLKHV